MLPFSPQKLALFLWTVIFSEGDYELSGWQNDKTSNIWYFVFATTTFALKLVAEWRRVPLLVVVLVLESKGFY